MANLSGERRILLKGGEVLAGGADRENAATGSFDADVLIENGRIRAVGSLGSVLGAHTIDCTSRMISPGFIDAHSHADAAIFREDVQLALLRQGITTAIGGQDGVSFAPGDGRYGTEYFAAINGAHPTYRGGGVAELLASYDGATPLNAAYLVPAGTVRHEIMGSTARDATHAEIAGMVGLVREGIGAGAVGLSTGLDYVPGLYAGATEIAALCAPVAEAGLPYVTHMRGGYEHNAEAGVLEIAEIARLSGAPVHISHFHTPAAEARRLMQLLADKNIAATFDAYGYTRGCTLVAMALLPPRFNSMPVGEAVVELSTPEVRAELRRNWFPGIAHKPSLGPDWPKMITIGHTPSPEFTWAHGLTLAQIAEKRSTDAIDATLDLLGASRMEVNAVMAVRDQRPIEDLGVLFALEGHIGGSDGIFVGAHPHPRGFGNFTRYLETFVRDHSLLDWGTAIAHLSTAPAELFHLGDRGRIVEGAIADLCVIDPNRLRERATYDEPAVVSEGIDDVLVAGVPVLENGELTGATPGMGLRHHA